MVSFQLVNISYFHISFEVQQNLGKCSDLSAEPPPADQHSHPAQWHLELNEGILNSLIQILDKGVREDWPSTEPRGAPLVTGHQLDLIRFTATLWIPFICLDELRPAMRGSAQQSLGPALGSQVLQSYSLGKKRLKS